MSTNPTTTDRTTARAEETEVYLGKSRYHASRGQWGCACPEYTNLETGTISEARENDLEPCGVCEPEGGDSR